MRVLQVVPTIGNESAGPSYSVPGLCRGLVNSSCEVNLLFTGTCPNREFPFDVTVSPIVKWPLARLGRSPEMYRQLLRLAETVDVIHNNSFWMFPNVYPYQVVQKLKRAGKKAPKLVNAPRGTLAAWSLKRHAWQKRLFGWFAGQYAAMRATDMWHATSEKEYEEIRAAGFKQPVAIVPIGMDIPKVGSGLRVESCGLRVEGRELGVEGAEFTSNNSSKDFVCEDSWFDLADASFFWNMPPAEIGVAPIIPDKKGVKECFRKFGKVVNAHDGVLVTFPAASAGKVLYQSGMDIRRVVPSFKVLFENAKLAWREHEEKMEGHKYHFNVKSYANYVNKFLLDGVPYFIRFTVREIGKEFGVHASTISGVSLYGIKTDGAPADSILENPEDGQCAPFTRSKISQLQATVKGAQYQFVDLKLRAFLNMRRSCIQVKSPRLHRLAFFGRLHTVKRIDMLLRAWELLTQLELPMSGGSTPPNNSSIGNSPHPYLLTPFPSPLSPQPSTLNPQLTTLNSQLKTQNWELVIAGPDGGVRAELESYVASHHLPRVRFVGEINGSAKYDFLTAADLYVLPSATENFGVTLAEALACGTPSLGSKGTPWSELNEWHCGSWGFDTAEELAAELAKLMALSDEERMEMGKRGQELIRTNYSWDGIGQKMRMAYEWLCHGGSVPDWVRID